MADVVSDLRSAASSYLAAAQILSVPTNVRGNQFTLHMRPYLTCLAFSAELHIKCLLAIDGKTDNDLHGHNLKVLHNKLSTKLKDNLCATHKELFNKDFDSNYYFNEDHVKPFVDWRYTHEFGNQLKSISMEVLCNFIKLVSSQIEKELKRT
jgi:hypothetical protein